MSFDNSPLNINLIIPFKDNRVGRLDLYVQEIHSFKERLEAEIEIFKDKLDTIFGEDFELSIVGRSDGNSKRFYWRFKSSKRDRKFCRLVADTIRDYIGQFSEYQIQQIKQIEEQIIYINANLKLLKGILDSIEISKTEITELHSF